MAIIRRVKYSVHRLFLVSKPGQGFKPYSRGVSYKSHILCVYIYKVSGVLIGRRSFEPRTSGARCDVLTSSTGNIDVSCGNDLVTQSTPAQTPIYTKILMCQQQP